MDWRKTILEEFTPGVADYFIVDDIDHLLSEPGIQKILTSKGFEFYLYDDSISLRQFYELKIRGGKNCNIPLIISIDDEEVNARELPFDIINNAKIVSLSITDCFPDLHHEIVKSLEPEELDILHEAIDEYAPGKLSDTASCDFVMRHVYQIVPEIIKAPPDLLMTLLRVHYRDIKVPILIKQRLVDILLRRKQFSEWPLKEIVFSRQAFFDFLQENWVKYVEVVKKNLAKEIKESPGSYLVENEEPQKVVLPFDHDDVKVYIDNLFLEGLLKPIEIDSPGSLKDHWCVIGVKISPETELTKRISGLVELCSKTLPSQEDRHQTWIQFAARWSELSSLINYSTENKDKEEYYTLRAKVDENFTGWMLGKYQSLHNHPPIPPAILHHVPSNMARDIGSSKDGRSALILIDGLAGDQWVTIKNNLANNYAMEEAGVFAWVPTVTSVSRQALFSGKAPYHFATSIQTTSAEPNAWKNFWLDRGLDSSEVYYEKGLGTGDVASLIDRLSDHRIRAVALVINTVDDIMHGMQLGSPGMYNQVELWAKSGYLTSLIDALSNYGYSIHITSDHGNVEARGCGKISEGAIAESRGERARVYQTEALRTKVYEAHTCSSTSVVEWPQIGLPSDYWPIVMAGRDAFVAEDETIVAHGGISIEEVIVPYIKISRDVL